jgi:hypothetical protein
MAEHRICSGVNGPVGCRRRRDQRHLNVATEQASNKIVDVTLEATEAMQRID